MNTAEIREKLAEKIKKENLCVDCSMHSYTSFRVGGKADLLILPQSKSELQYALQVLACSKTPYIIMGNGTNILVRDGGYRGTIVKLGDAFSSVEIKGTELRAACGTLMSTVAKSALSAGLAGFEFAGGIPGSLGGAVFMNAGAYGGEMVQILKEVTVLSKDGKRESILPVDQLELDYRYSIFHRTGDVVLDITLQLKKGEKQTIGTKMKELTDRRNEKQPVSLPSAGSFFKRPKGFFAGKLIQDAGLKGLELGGAQVSPLHSGFIVNTGSATATDIIQLMELVQATVRERFGVNLEPEVRIIGE